MRERVKEEGVKERELTELFVFLKKGRGSGKFDVDDQCSGLLSWNNSSPLAPSSPAKSGGQQEQHRRALTHIVRGEVVGLAAHDLAEQPHGPGVGLRRGRH